MDKKVSNIKELSNFQKVALSLIAKSPGLGKVQLNKGLFLFDSIYYAFHKKSYTGCHYIKEAYGPVPENKFYQQLKRLLEKNTEQKIEYKGYYEKTSFYIQFGAELPIFDEELNKILITVVNFISNKTAAELSELTHDEVYKKTKKRAVIPFDQIVQWLIDKPEDTDTNVYMKDLTSQDETNILQILSSN